MEGGQVRTAIYGGCNSSGAVSGVVNVNVLGGTLGTDANHTINIHGGGYGQATSTGDDVNVNIGQESKSVADEDHVGGYAINGSVTLSGNAEIMGNVYGGGNRAAVEGNTQVKME